MKKVNEAQLKNRRDRLASDLGDGVVVLNSFGEKQVRSHFTYLTEMKSEHDTLVLEIKNGKIAKETYFRKHKTDKELQWDGMELEDHEIKEQTQGLDIDDITKLNETIKAHEKSLIAGERVSTVLSKMRLIKDAGELAKIRRACEISVGAHEHLLKNLTADMTENQLAAHFEWFCKMQNAEALAYNSIVASGDNSTFLHHKTKFRKTKNEDLLLVDAGSMYENYCSDITRTWPVSGKFTTAQKEIYEVVLTAQKEALKVIAPGKTLKDVDQAARAVIEDFANHSGQKTEDLFPHGTSHWLGLDVHDAGEKESLLKEGMVFTVEPGIYFHRWLTKKNEVYDGIGIRIEDDVVVTTTGCEVLTKNLKKEIS